MARPRRCNPVIPRARGAGSGLHFRAGKLLGQAGETGVSLQKQGQRELLRRGELHKTLPGLWGASDFHGFAQKTPQTKASGRSAVSLPVLFFLFFFPFFSIHTFSFSLLTSCTLLAETRSGLWASQAQLPVTSERCTAGFTHCKTPLRSSPDLPGVSVLLTVLPWGCGCCLCTAAWAVFFPCGFLQRLAAAQEGATGCPGGNFPLQEGLCLPLPPQKHLAPVLLEVSSQIRRNSLEKMKTEILLLAVSW